MRWEVGGLEGMPRDYHAYEDELRDLVQIEQSQIGDGRQPLEDGPFQGDGGEENGKHGLQSELWWIDVNGEDCEWDERDEEDKEEGVDYVEARSSGWVAWGD